MPLLPIVTIRFDSSIGHHSMPDPMSLPWLPFVSRCQPDWLLGGILASRVIDYGERQRTTLVVMMVN